MEGHSNVGKTVLKMNQAELGALASSIYGRLHYQDRALVYYRHAADKFVQIYWQPSGSKALEEYRRGDPRIRITFRNDLWAKVCDDYELAHPGAPVPEYLRANYVALPPELPPAAPAEQDRRFPWMLPEYANSFLLCGSFYRETDRRLEFVRHTGFSLDDFEKGCSLAYILTRPTAPGKIPIVIKIGKSNKGVKKNNNQYLLLPHEPAPGHARIYTSRSGPAREMWLWMENSEEAWGCDYSVFVLPHATAPGMNPKHVRSEAGLLEEDLVAEHKRVMGYIPRWNVQEAGGTLAKAGAEMELELDFVRLFA